ncbi:hypothetical protein STANM309S_04557 [Streptomyces tanashiensis]
MNTLNIVKPPEGTKAPVTAPSAAPNFASKSVPRHLARGVIGFGLIIGSIAMVPVAGPATLLAAPLALIAFLGRRPAGWWAWRRPFRGRLERQCVDGVCTLTKADPAAKKAS